MVTVLEEVGRELSFCVFHPGFERGKYAQSSIQDAILKLFLSHFCGNVMHNAFFKKTVMHLLGWTMT